MVPLEPIVYAMPQKRRPPAESVTIHIEDFPKELRWELRAAAAEAETTLREYVIAALKNQLKQDRLTPAS